MIPIMMIWGVYPFEVSTTAYQQLTRETGWNWPEQGVIGSSPVLQYTGKAAETIDLQGMLCPGITGDRTSLEWLRRLGDLGKPLPLVSGQGLFLGLWVLEKLTQGEDVHFQDGTPRRMSFNLKFKKSSDNIGPITAKLTAISRIAQLFG